ncbi:AraC family transcriptional regulator [Bacillus sp. N9]
MYNEEKWQTNEQIFYRLKDIVESIIAYASKRQHASRNQIIQKILNKVDERLYEEISLQDLADEVFVNSSYLSRLFKREIGQSFQVM